MELQGFPERLREAIAAADLTIAETAKLSGLALSTVQFYLSGRRDNPSGENVLALSTVLGCGAGWLLAGEGDAPTPAEALAAVERARKAPLQPAADAAPAEVA